MKSNFKRIISPQTTSKEEADFLKLSEQILDEKTLDWTNEYFIPKAIITDKLQETRAVIEVSLSELNTMLLHGSFKEQEKACYQIIRMGKSVPLGLLKKVEKLLQDPSDTIRMLAAMTLGEVGGEEQCKTLMSACHDISWQVRASIVQALGNLSQYTPIDVLLQLLNDPEATVREAAIWALKNQEKHPTLLALASMLRDENDLVRIAAIEAIKDLQDNDTKDSIFWMFKQAFTDECELVRATSIQAIMTYDQAIAEPFFIRALKDVNALVRHAAIQAQKNHQELISIEPLILALKDSNPIVRTEVSIVLGKFQHDVIYRVSKRFLLVALQDDNNDIRALALWILGKRNTSDSLEHIRAALGDSDETVRTVAAWAILQMKKNDEYLDDNHSERRRQIDLGEKKNMSTISRSIQHFALPLLRQIGRSVFLTLLDFLADKKGFMRAEIYQEQTLVVIINYQIGGHPIYEVLNSTYNFSHYLEPVARALNSEDVRMSEMIHHIMKRQSRHSWSEFFMLSLKRSNMPNQKKAIPQKLVICTFGYSHVRADDASIRQIINCYEEKEKDTLEDRLHTYIDNSIEHIQEFDGINKLLYDTPLLPVLPEEPLKETLEELPSTRRKSDIMQI